MNCMRTTSSGTFAVYLIPSRLHRWLEVYWWPIIFFMRSRGTCIPRLQRRWLSHRANCRKIPFIQFSMREENRSQEAHRHGQGKPGEQGKKQRDEVHDLHLLSLSTG